MTSFTYVGSGRFLEGVPARDLVDEEYASLSTDRQNDVRKCGLYEEQKPVAATAVMKPDATPATAVMKPDATPATAATDEKDGGN